MADLPTLNLWTKVRSPFEVVKGVKPQLPINLTPSAIELVPKEDAEDFARGMKDVCDEVRQQDCC